MIAQIPHRPAILAMLMSAMSPSLRGGLSQSMPVDSLRWTLSTKIAQSTIGTPQASSPQSAASGPAIP